MHTSFKRIVIILQAIAVLISCRQSHEQDAMRRLERAHIIKKYYANYDEQLKAFRKELGLTQRQLTEMVSVRYHRSP